MNKPKISIITITLNSERTIKRAIESVISQDYDNLEYIIIDGKSTDNTLKIIYEYCDKISCIISEPDDGISDAFNKGIKIATGEIIGIVNSDDGLLPGALNYLAQNYSKSVDLYRGKTLLWKEDTNVKVVEEPTIHLNYGGRNHICHQSTFISKRAYERIGYYDTRYKYAMDYDVLLKLQNQKAVVKKLDYVMAFYSLGGITATKYTTSRRNEITTIILSNGGGKIGVYRYLIYSCFKQIIKSFIPKEITMRMR